MHSLTSALQMRVNILKKHELTSLRQSRRDLMCNQSRFWCWFHPRTGQLHQLALRCVKIGRDRADKYAVTLVQVAQEVCRLWLCARWKDSREEEPSVSKKISWAHMLACLWVCMKGAMIAHACLWSLSIQHWCTGLPQTEACRISPLRVSVCRQGKCVSAR